MSSALDQRPVIVALAGPNGAANTVSIDTKSLVERQPLADGSVNQVSLSRIAQGKNIGFDDNQQLLHSLRKLSQHRLNCQ